MKKKSISISLLILFLIAGPGFASSGGEVAKGDEQSRMIEGQALILHRKYDEALKLFKGVKKTFRIPHPDPLVKWPCMKSGCWRMKT
ncbi:MAG TPA: hypothetical protein PKW68_04695 [bacterium]|nr:hypothetical protein [bacterium]